MASYLVTYRRTGGAPETEPIFGVLSDAAARNCFLSLPWVGFEPIEVISVEPMAAPEKPFDPFNARQGPPFDWRAECDRLTDRIGQLADEAQALDRAGRHEAAKAKREKAKQIAADRAELTRRSKGR